MVRKQFIFIPNGFYAIYGTDSNLVSKLYMNTRSSAVFLQNVNKDDEIKSHSLRLASLSFNRGLLDDLEGNTRLCEK